MRRNSCTHSLFTIGAKVSTANVAFFNTDCTKCMTDGDSSCTCIQLEMTLLRDVVCENFSFDAAISK